jgi:hypothetical protein
VLRLLLAIAGNRAHQIGQLLRNGFDLLERPPGLYSQLGLALHLARSLFHGRDGRASAALNGADQRTDALGRFDGTSGQFLDLIRNNDKAMPGITRGRCLNRSVERENGGAVGNFVNQVQNLFDFVRAFAQLLNAPGRLLDLFENPLCAVHRVLHDCGVRRWRRPAASCAPSR